MFRHARITVLAACCIALITMGCGGADSPVPVQGVVKLDGEPLAGATVTFMSSEDDIRRPAAGYTDQDGVFHLTSFKKDDGALRGEYRVLVTKIQPIEAPPDSKSGEPDAVLNHYQSLKSQERKWLLPLRYASFDSTPFRCKVPPEGKVVFELQSEPINP
jgi:hypothetical protein